VIVCWLVAVASVFLSQPASPRESSGCAAATDALVSAFDRADVIVLGEGHGRKADADFRVALGQAMLGPQSKQTPINRGINQ